MKGSFFAGKKSAPNITFCNFFILKKVMRQLYVYFFTMSKSLAISKIVFFRVGSRKMKFLDEICKGRLLENFRVYEYVRMANSKPGNIS